MKVLVTGAAGFIGAAVTQQLVDGGHQVTAVDAFIEQAHDASAERPVHVDHLDVRDLESVVAALDGVDVVCHQAAMVGAGVTTADLPLYASHNDLGTAVLLAAMGQRGVSRLVLASSMVVYGDGRYRCVGHGVQPPTVRRLKDLEAGVFGVRCPLCDRTMEWELVDEDAALSPRSSYAASKVAQEHYAIAWARQLPAAVVALRYHNVYGPGMPRDTPYSGVAAIFRSALEAGRAPQVFEDGGQMRDFVHVSDVARANVAAIEQVVGDRDDSFTSYNVCSGQPISISEVAELVATGTGRSDLTPVTTGEFRSGDVRHIVASPKRASSGLGFSASVSPTQGLVEFATAELR